jgi:hypothetical protein
VHTYLFKLGPELLGAGYTVPLDRRIAVSLPALSMRLRLLDMARLLVEGAAPALEARRGALHLVNLGGGPAADSWNALLLLQKQRPELLRDRPVRILVLDPDPAGPAFGARALDALQAEGAPLHGVDARLVHAAYDWAKPEALRALLQFAADDVVALSTEGALFEYGDDATVLANLKALAELLPRDAPVVGSVTGDDEVAAWIQRGSDFPLKPRSAVAFANLAASAGWIVAESITRPACRDVLLERARTEPSAR